jgi:hypothetical protein
VSCDHGIHKSIIGLLTTTDDKQLAEAKKQVTAGDAVCPSCKAAIVLSGETLSMFNAALGLEGHTCPACGHTLSRRRPSLDGF